MALPINLNNLITGKTVEWDRIEFKAGWNPEDVLHTICAFANDVNNWGGGYIITGIAEQDGMPVLPPVGLKTNQIDKMQKELVKLTNTLDPFYSPVTEPVEFNGKTIFIIWAPGGQTRPYKAPVSLSSKGAKQYYIRRGSTTVKANHAEIKQLMELAATVPFDDRVNHHASLQNLDLGLIREFLQEIKSDLFELSTTMPLGDLCRRMRIAAGPSEHLRPVNAGLLFFNPNPDGFFRGAITEVTQFKDDTGTEFTEHIFKGPIHRQIKATLEFLRNNVIAERVIKVRGKAEADRFFNFPYEAVEETLVNAYYHRSYEHQSSIEINIHPDKIEILSFPGPLPPITNETLKSGRVVSRDYRNRRIGDFLKELDLTEGRGTGFPKIYRKMQNNGSPRPIFETDDEQVSFLAILPVHPVFLIDIKKPELSKMEEKILEACLVGPTSRKEIALYVGLSPHAGTLKRLLPKLVADGLLAYTIPDTPKSKRQQYELTTLGQSAFK